MKIINTGDWHIGNFFFNNDRLPEHRHFLKWLLDRIIEHQPDALLVAGDVFDNGNPSSAARSAYYTFLADATKACPNMSVIITAGNHDSASRLEAPRALLSRYKIEVRGNVSRTWEKIDEDVTWHYNYDELIIPVEDSEGNKVVVLAVPYLRSDTVQGTSYSQGVSNFLRELTTYARTKYADIPIVMMAHMYAKGADIARRDASETILIGGQEEVNMEGWEDHPDYMTCGHIHKRQHIWNTNWARYTGSVLPMSFAEVDYTHGVDLLTISADHKCQIQFLEYVPQHRLMVLPDDDAEMTPKQIKKLLSEKLADRTDDKLGEDFVYLVLKIIQEKIDNDTQNEIRALVDTKNAVLCKFQTIDKSMDMRTMTGGNQIHSIDDILNRDPLDTLKEAFTLKHNNEMSERQEAMLKELLETINEEEEQ